MRMTTRALFLSCAAALSGGAFAGTIAVTPNTATAPQVGGATNPTPHMIVYTQAAAGETTNNFTARLVYDATKLTATVPAGDPVCSQPAGGSITILTQNNTAGLLASGTQCTVTFASIAGAALGATPLDLQVNTNNGEGCLDNVGNATGTACTLTDGTITISIGTFNYTVAPTTLTFNGTVGVASASQNVNVSAPLANTGNLSITACTFGGANPGDYSLSPAPAFPLSVAPGASVNLPVVFTAGAIGPRNATLSCTSNGTAIGGDFPVTLNGTGVTNTLTATPVLTFPATNIGSTVSQNVVATAGAGNTGNVTITSCAISGANAGDFAQTPATTNVVVTPGASVNVPVAFTPSGASSTATLTCTLSGGPANFVTTLNGTGIPVDSAFTSNPTNGTTIQALGTAGAPLTRPVGFTNTGTAAGTVTCTATAGFTVTNSPLALAVGASGTVSVTATSATPATLNGTLTCTGSNAGATVFTFPLVFAFGTPAVAQIPAVGNAGLFALLGLFAGVGMLVAFRTRN